MAKKRSGTGYITCPVCDAEIPLSGDEKPGEEFGCPYCQSPFTIKKKKGEEDELSLEEDF